MKVRSQLKEEFLDGRRSFIFSWNTKHREIHEQALKHFFDQSKKGQKFEYEPPGHSELSLRDQTAPPARDTEPAHQLKLQRSATLPEGRSRQEIKDRWDQPSFLQKDYTSGQRWELLRQITFKKTWTRIMIKTVTIATKISINTRTKITKTKLSKETTITTTTLAPRDIDNINHNRGNSTWAKNDRWRCQQWHLKPCSRKTRKDCENNLNYLNPLWHEHQ